MKPILFFLACFSIVTEVQGQKLPDTQEKPVWVTKPIRIDGKLDSSYTTLSAYNKNTSLSYSICNDERNLYLLLKAADPAVISKIMLGGITFTVNTEGKKRSKDAYSITYPVVSGRSGGQRRFGAAGFGMGQQGGNRQRPDSAAIAAMRKEQLAQMKEIGVSGFKGISDSLISIYNEYGIKAAVNYDKEGSFVYELAVPFQQIELTLEKAKELMCNIQLNGRQFVMRGMSREDGAGTRTARGNTGGGGGFGGGGFGGGMRVMGGGARGFDPSIFEPTDFWVRYSPVKK